MDEIGEKPLLLILGPLGGNKNTFNLKGFKKWSDPETLGAPAVTRFIAEARYFFQIHRTVFNYFVKKFPPSVSAAACGPEGETSRAKRKRQSLYALVFNVGILTKMDPQDDDSETDSSDMDVDDLAGTEDDVGEQRGPFTEFELAVMKSVELSKGYMAGYIDGSTHNAGSTGTVPIESLVDIKVFQNTYSVFQRLKDCLKNFLNTEVTRLKKKFNIPADLTNINEFTETHLSSIHKLVYETYNYNGMLKEIELEVSLKDEMLFSYPPTNVPYADFREGATDPIHHAIYAHGKLISKLIDVAIRAYILFQKTHDLEKKLLEENPREYEKLQRSKRRVARPEISNLGVPLDDSLEDDV